LYKLLFTFSGCEREASFDIAFGFGDGWKERE
jgi:hypothetical protein